MEFITMVHPAQKDSASLRRQAHSHAARFAHARARERRMVEHTQPKQILENAGGDDEVADSEERLSSNWRNLASFVRNETTPVLPQNISGAFEHEPLASFLGSLKPREHYMFQHYVQVVVPEMLSQCPVLNYMRKHNDHVRNNWVLLNSAHMEFLKGFLLAACRHLSTVKSDREYAEIAIQYKLRYIQDLRRTILVDGPSSRREAVTRALVLAFDDIMIQDISMASNHVLGAINIIQAAGGSQVLGLSDLVRYILYNCVHAKRLLDWMPVLD
ncbi:hypothetical protein GCG54_00010526 [Colletotrichum gloeosporioides]|uniref:Uncharacterized protein n=1 Tax=Colletotrichum gloeosporioides TaxID=474922 RepID=A0A8H4C673_COLGL|nr:uncharacterized protein GCG54_00010526 [Colletotrichum gloeosporioides]KAF3798180.1 hypothetical protein GCG54_00010526 [Colletotrichum gloeosporioides]